MPEGFLAVDSILNIFINIADGLVVYPKMIEKRVIEELPFMVTENILMEAVKKGGDRQILHEKIRLHSMDAANRVKNEGLSNDLIERISQDSAFNMNKDELQNILNPKDYIGRSAQQVEDFLKNQVKAVLDANPVEDIEVSLNV